MLRPRGSASVFTALSVSAQDGVVLGGQPSKRTLTWVKMDQAGVFNI